MNERITCVCKAVTKLDSDWQVFVCDNCSRVGVKCDCGRILCVKNDEDDRKFTVKCSKCNTENNVRLRAKTPPKKSLLSSIWDKITKTNKTNKYSDKNGYPKLQCTNCNGRSTEVINTQKSYAGQRVKTINWEIGGPRQMVVNVWEVDWCYYCEDCGNEWVVQVLEDNDIA